VSIIKEVSLKNLTNWSVKYLINFDFNFDEKYKQIKLEELLVKNTEKIVIKDNVKYSRVKIKLYGRGVECRDTLYGKEIGVKKQYKVKKGQFILSKIDARNGAFGIVPDFLEGSITTSDFLSYEINKEKVLSDFLKIILTTKKFRKFCQNASTGTTNRQRIHEKLFLNVKIPVPTLQEQKKIMKKYNQKIDLAKEAENKFLKLKKDISKIMNDKLGIKKIHFSKMRGLQVVDYKDLEGWKISNTQLIKSTFNLVKLKDLILEISTGATPPTNIKEYFDGNINFYTPADLTDVMYLENSKRKISQLAIDRNKARVFKKGTLLFVGIGSTIGKVSLINNEIASSNQQITGLVINTKVINTEFLYFYFNYFPEITTQEKTLATIPIINQKKILNIFVPHPPIKIQLEIVEAINKLREQIILLKNNAKKNREKAIDEFEKEIFNNEN